MRIGALLALCSAVSLGLISKFSPHLFFRIPNIGFIIHHIITGESLPPYMSADAWAKDEVNTWIRDGDLVVAVGIKSGTHWMQYCTHQIRMKASDDADDYFPDSNIAAPWVELIHNPGGSWEEQKPLYNTAKLADGTLWKDFWDSPRYPFRIFKSHMAEDLPVEDLPNVKFLAMSRNGLDVIRSALPFFLDHREEFRSLWGGFPPTTELVGFEKDVEFWFHALLPGGNLYNQYFPYVKHWWSLRNNPNVLLLHYADAVRDLSGTVKKISKFLDVELTKQQHKEVVRRCGLEHMRTIKDRFLTTCPLNRKYGPGFHVVNPGSAIRDQNEQRVGEFTPEQKARWRAAEESEFTDLSLLKWSRDGERGASS